MVCFNYLRPDYRESFWNIAKDKERMKWNMAVRKLSTRLDMSLPVYVHTLTKAEIQVSNITKILSAAHYYDIAYFTETKICDIDNEAR